MPVNLSSFSGSNLTSYVSATSANTLYSSAITLKAGVYTITCASTTVASLDFYSGTTYIGSTQTVSGTVSYNLASDATRIAYYTNTGSNITIGILQTGNPVTTAVSGTLDTLTSSTTYTQTGNTGLAYVVVVGGGGGGGSATSSYSCGGGGGSGGVQSSTYALTGSISVTIGAGGNGSSTSATGNAGGATIFGNLTSNGGGGGSSFNSGGNDQASGGAPGSPGGAYGGSSGQFVGSPGGAQSASTASAYNFVVSGTTGGGGGGKWGPGVSNGWAGGSGSGSGIGTGGNGSTNTAGGAGNGYGSGGGGGCSGYSGGAGKPGVVYIVRA